jgi:hypothetical protein
MSGRPRDLASIDNEQLVKLGVAQFVDIKNIQADEPIALLALAAYFTKNTAWTSEHFINDRLLSPNASERGSGMESFAAYLLGFNFSTFVPLSKVFRFVGDDRPLFHRRGRLVSLYRNEVNG